MKAVNNNGVITFYSSLPEKFRSSTGVHLNVKNWSDEQMESHGLFDVVIDESYDSRIHDLGEIYWDVANTVFRKDIVAKTWEKTLEELKIQRINNYKNHIGNQLSKTDWYVIRQADNSEAIPTEIVDERQALRDLTVQVETEINELTTKEQVLTYDFPSYES